MHEYLGKEYGYVSLEMENIIEIQWQQLMENLSNKNELIIIL